MDAEVFKPITGWLVEGGNGRKWVEMEETSGGGGMTGRDDGLPGMALTSGHKRIYDISDIV